jgi:hypothetical protein
MTSPVIGVPKTLSRFRAAAARSEHNVIDSGGQKSPARPALANACPSAPERSCAIQAAVGFSDVFPQRSDVNAGSAERPRPCARATTRGPKQSNTARRVNWNAGVGGFSLGRSTDEPKVSALKYALN